MRKSVTYKESRSTRSATTTFLADGHGREFFVRTRHSRANKTIVTRMGRQVPRDDTVREVIGLRADDLNPIMQREVIGVSRYSQRKVREAHDAFIRKYVEGPGQLHEHLEWAKKARL